MILIIGASGLLGSALCKRLSENGHLVKAMTRKPEQFDKAACPKVTVTYGDLTIPESLAEALKGVKTVIASAHSLLGKGRNNSPKVDGAGHKTLIDLCVAQGIEHFIYISMFGAAENHAVDFIRNKYQTEQYLQQSGLAYTIIRPTAFMELHAHKLIGESVLTKGKVRIFGRGKNQFNFVAVNDVATLISAQLSHLPANKTIEIGGPSNITRTELAQLYGKYAGRKPKIAYTSPGTLKTLSKIIKPFHPGISRIMHMSATMDETDYSFDYTKQAGEFPFPLTDIDAFVKEKAGLFKNR